MKTTIKQTLLQNRAARIEEAIKQGFKYDPITGKIWGIKGKEITTTDCAGYTIINVNVDGKYWLIKGHHIAYYYIHGKVVSSIDHINGIKSDNRIENLREATHSENMRNIVGARGYYFNKNSRKYHAQINADGTIKYLGSFLTEAEAREAYIKAKIKYHNIDLSKIEHKCIKFQS